MWKKTRFLDGIVFLNVGTDIADFEKGGVSQMMKTLKKMALVVGIMVPFAALSIVSVGARSEDDAFKVETAYKSKCVACHGPKAEKKFDATIAEDEMVQIVLKGKKAEKPPNMPGYEAKGITADQAKALVTYMKSLKQ